MDWLSVTANPWVGGALLIVTDHIQVRLGIMLNHCMGLWSPVDCTVTVMYYYVTYHNFCAPFRNVLFCNVLYGTVV